MCTTICSIIRSMYPSKVRVCQPYVQKYWGFHSPRFVSFSIFHKLFIQLLHLVYFYGYAYLSYCVEFFALCETNFLSAFGGRLHQLFFGRIFRLLLSISFPFKRDCTAGSLLVHVVLSVSCFGLMRRRNERLPIGTIYILFC